MDDDAVVTGFDPLWSVRSRCECGGLLGYYDETAPDALVCPECLARY